ncbi:MAG: hypothetical protein ACLGI6_19210 [Gammaproteobacteria bacterium]
MYQVVLDMMLGISTAASVASAAPAVLTARASAEASAARPATTVPADVPVHDPTGLPQRRSSLLGRAAGIEQLGEARGGTETVASASELGGEVASNSASHLSTGANSIATGSLSGAVGLPVVIQNSGANVLIQNSTIVNVQFK